ncbi:hypothetical protein SAMN05877838_3135, partial [Hoeflea halophila]
QACQERDAVARRVRTAARNENRGRLENSGLFKMNTENHQKTTSLSHAEDYFLEVLTPNKKAFFNTSSTFATALNLATSLFHFHEWLFDEFRPDLEIHYGIPLSSKGRFWQITQNSNSKFGYIRDVTNASKHVRIGGAGHQTSTGMTHIANTHIVAAGWQVDGLEEGGHGGDSIVFDDGGNQIIFDDCARELFDHWQTLLQSLTGKLYT